MRTFPIFLVLATALQSFAQSGNGLPVEKIYGVNLGSWLLLEPWMLPQEWARMGGDTCFETGPCSSCAASEFALVQKLGQDKADQVFRTHWDTWFNEGDVQRIARAGLNTVRIPLGYWIIEPLVNRDTEFYPRGGIKQLKRGLAQLKAAGIYALLDFHALPGVSSPNQMFAGHCTSDVQFYTDPNYFRALQWAAVTTFISHIDPDFSKVFAIEAVNEPIMNPAQTPGYGDYLTDFTLVIRAMEFALGITCPGVDYSSVLKVAAKNGASPVISDLASGVGGRVGKVLLSVIPIIAQVSAELGIDNPIGSGSRIRRADILKRADANRQCLHTTYMDTQWQGPNGFNPANATVGPALFDDHLYFSFGGVADPNPTSYLQVICNLPRVTQDNAKGNGPMVFGEWAISTNFEATDDFLNKWADAQKLMYSQSSGWIFWSFKIENGVGFQREWDYFTALDAGHFTADPKALHNPGVCDPYRH